MIWVTWRQHRGAALIGVVGLALLALVLIPTGLRMAADYQQLNLGTCVATVGSTAQPANCADSIGAFQQRYLFLATNFAVLLLLPLLVAFLSARPWSRVSWSKGRICWPGRRASLVSAGWR
jgi:hypothetical protein